MNPLPNKGFQFDGTSIHPAESIHNILTYTQSKVTWQQFCQAQRFLISYTFLFFSWTCSWSLESAEFLAPAQAASQSIPLIMGQPEDGKVKLGWLKISCDSTSEGTSGGPQFLFEGQPESPKLDSFRSQLWISALSSAIALQQPWQEIKWTISEMPAGDVSESGAALAIALIATASGAKYPQDTVILGRLNPDGSLGSILYPAARIKAAAEAGMKRVIMPNSQRFEIADGGRLLNIPVLTEDLGIECILADDLIEATEIALHRKMPSAPSAQNSPRYSIKLLGALDSMCRIDLDRLREVSQSWPRSDAQFKALTSQEQYLWKKIFENYDRSINAYASGKLYLARQLTRQVNAYQCALTELKTIGEAFDYKIYDERGNSVRRKMLDQMSKSSVDKNELQSAVVLAEESDRIYRLNTAVEGAQMIARQAFSARSDATPQQKWLAQILLVSAVSGAECQMKGPNFYSENYNLLVTKEEIPTYNRSSIWLPQLRQAQLGASVFFVSGLKSRSEILSGSLLFDPRLSGFERVLQTNKLTQEQADQKATIQAVNDGVEKLAVGFFPGEGYSIPKTPPLPVQIPSSSEAALCMNWVNEYCELAILNEKYLRLGGSFDSNTLEWNVKNEAALQGMLQVADLGARRGIAFAESAGVDSAILAMIYEVASTLRLSEDNNLRMEALRQYWRCALLGSMCWQLGHIPRAIADNAEPSNDAVLSIKLPPASPPPKEAATPPPHASAIAPGVAAAPPL